MFNIAFSIFKKIHKNHHSKTSVLTSTADTYMACGFLNLQNMQVIICNPCLLSFLTLDLIWIEPVFPGLCFSPYVTLLPFWSETSYLLPELSAPSRICLRKHAASLLTWILIGQDIKMAFFALKIYSQSQNYKTCFLQRIWSRKDYIMGDDKLISDIIYR